MADYPPDPYKPAELLQNSLLMLHEMKTRDKQMQMRDKLTEAEVGEIAARSGLLGKQYEQAAYSLQEARDVDRLHQEVMSGAWDERLVANPGLLAALNSKLGKERAIDPMYVAQRLRQQLAAQKPLDLPQRQFLREYEIGTRLAPDASQAIERDLGWSRIGVEVAKEYGVVYDPTQPNYWDKVVNEIRTKGLKPATLLQIEGMVKQYDALASYYSTGKEEDKEGKRLAAVINNYTKMFTEYTRLLKENPDDPMRLTLMNDLGRYRDLYVQAIEKLSGMKMPTTGAPLPEAPPGLGARLGNLLGSIFGKQPTTIGGVDVDSLSIEELEQMRKDLEASQLPPVPPK